MGNDVVNNYRFHILSLRQTPHTKRMLTKVGLTSLSPLVTVTSLGCSEPICFENILQRLFSDYGLTMNFEQYVLVGSIVRSYLSWLKDDGKLDVTFEDNILLWNAV